jgi:hypothetical protein
MSGRTFEPKRDDVTGGWENLHDEEFQNLHEMGSAGSIYGSERESMLDFGGKARRK